MSLNEVKGEDFRGGTARRGMCHCEPMQPSLKRSEDTLVVEGRDVERVTVLVKISCH